MSADQEWSEAIKASIENAKEGSSYPPSMAQQETQADFLPTSSQSPGNSPQPSPDSQQRDLPLAPPQSLQQQQLLSITDAKPNIQQASNINLQQDQHISQSGMSPSNSNPSFDHALRKVEPESQQALGDAPPQIQNKGNPFQKNEQNISSNYPISKAPRHSQSLSPRSQQQNQGGIWSNIHMDPEMLVPTPSVPARQIMQQQEPQARQSTPQKVNQQRSQLNVNQQSMRLSSTLRPQHPQSVKQNFQRPNLPLQQNSGGPQQQVQRMQQQPPQHHRQAPVGTTSTGALGMHQGKKAALSGMNTPTVRLQFPTSQRQLRAQSPGHSQGSLNQPVPPKQAQRPSGVVGQGMPQLPVNRTANVSQNRMPGQFETFSNSHQQRQNNMNMRRLVQQGPGIQPLSFEDEDMFYDYDDDDDDDDDYDEDMGGDDDMEDMDFSRFEGSDHYGCPSSDSDELSEEESALLEELRVCEDDERYDQIISRLQEKGIDPEEIDEMMYHSSNPDGVYPGENYSENDGEDAVSSSSQHMTPFQPNQVRSYPRPGIPHQTSNKMGPGSSNGQNLKGALGASNIQSQQGVLSVPSGGFSNQGASSGTPSSGTNNQQMVSPPGLSSQQGKTPQVLQFQSQQQIPVNRTMQPGSQGQQQLKHIGQSNSNQHRKVFQSSGDKSGQTSSQISNSNWQPLQNIVRGSAQSQVRPGDPRTPVPRPSTQPGQSPGMQVQRPMSLNRPPQQVTPTQGQIGNVRQSGQTLSCPSGVVVRPVQHFTIFANNNQPNAAGQQGHSQQLVVRPGTSTSQMVISTVPASPQSGAPGTPSQVQAQATRAVRPRVPLQLPPKSQNQSQLGMQAMVQNQPQGNQRLFRPQNMQQQQNMKAAPHTVPSEASQARLNVLLMQQSLDQEIMAKKGMQVAQGQTQIGGNVRPVGQHRFNFPGTQSNRPFRPQQQQNQTFPAYQPKHQLPPRQPIPTINNPNLSLDTSPALSCGRPICSVIPFTNQTRGQSTSTTVQRPNAPSQSTAVVRPRNPAPVTLNVANSTQQLPTAYPPQINTSGTQQHPALTASSGIVPISQGTTPGNLQISVAQPLSSPQQSDHSQQAQVPQQQQQLPQSCGSNKAESFSLDRLSKDKCVLTGTSKNQGLVVNMIYQIRSPFDQSLVYALWNGERFEDVNSADLQGPVAGEVVTQGQVNQKAAQEVHKTLVGPVLPGSHKEKQKGTASPAGSENTSKFQAEFLQSLTRKPENEEQRCAMESASQASTCQDVNSESGQTSDATQQQASGDAGSSQATYVKPLPQGKEQKDEPMGEEEDDSVFKKPYSENEDYFRVCNHCGYTSKDFRTCEGCNRVFQGQVKVHVMKKNLPKTGIAATSSSPVTKTIKDDSALMKKDPIDQVMSSISFYGTRNGRGRGRGSRGGSGRTRGGGLKGRSGMRRVEGEEYDSSDSEDASVNGKRASDGSGSSNEGQPKRRAARPKSKNPAPRKRSRKLDEPVTVTISSDEDEPSSTSNNLLGHAPSPAHSAGSESPIFPSTPVEPVQAFGRFRRALMEDEEGNSKLSKKMQQRVATPPMERPEEEEDEEDDEDDGEEPPTYEIEIRSVRIGSMRTQPEGPLLINLRGVCFKVRSERTDEAFECEILAQEVEHVKYCSGQTQPVLFLFLTQECGEKLRSICRMEIGDDEYFDPSSTDMKQKMVVIIIEGFNYMPQEMLRETLSLWADVLQTDDENFIEELTEESANDLLIQSAPAVLTADIERDVVKFKRRYLRDTSDVPPTSRGPGSPSDSTDNEPDSTSSSPPETRHHHFFGTSVRLLQYPPPPARGLPITTEDLFCLTEGEFLNDVIIDFYLQYLYQEKLSEVNRRRTHVFSSFFYKRLTQRDRHSEKTEEDAKKSLPERRHARVKKWTKTVDLFSKDFIIVPINEHSHWYLAVICFPGLAAPEEVPFLPSNAHKEDVEDESNDGEGGEENASEESTSQESVPKTILGQQLDAKKCLENEHIKYCLGRKQPCILMFDSLAGPSRNPNVRMLREYLQCEWNAKKSEPRQIAKILRGSTPKVPQQSNYSDCGVFLLQYVESFFEDPIADFQVPMKGLQNWFPEELVLNKRHYIHDLIMNLHRQYQGERGERALDIKFESHPREPPFKANPMMEQNSRAEEGYGPGLGRDDESSNSSISGEMSRAELASEAPTISPMEEMQATTPNEEGLANTPMEDNSSSETQDQPEDQEEEHEKQVSEEMKSDDA